MPESGVEFWPLHCEVVVSRHSSMSGEELVRACVEGNDGPAWDEFVSRFRRPISLSIITTCLPMGEIPQQVVDDLVQDTYLKLCSNKCRQLQEFAAKHPEKIVGYVKTTPINVAHDHFKSLHSQNMVLAKLARSPRKLIQRPRRVSPAVKRRWSEKSYSRRLMNVLSLAWKARTETEIGQSSG